ncbi:M1 family metallopeptidase [Stackebrandtia soli]|uniref:M1 family metallopeptidase n=1 Tax=Stackebrandtia soli TaxID=1892856 RepID=UPI0039E88F87
MTSRIRVLAALGVAVALTATACTDPPAILTDAPPDTAPRDDLDAGRSDPVIDPLYPEIGHADIDVLHYQLDLEYDPAQRELRGWATLTIRPVETADDLSLDFSDALKVTEVLADGETVSDYEQEQWDLYVATPVVADETMTLAIAYSGTPRPIDAPSHRGDMTEGIGASIGPEGNLWSFQEPYGALTWYPSNDHPSDEALYDFAITVPDGYAGVASGTFMGVEDNTYRWSSSDPVASYLATIAVDRYTMTEMEGPSGLPITLWNTPDYPAFDPILERTPELIAWIEERYGPYPFDSAGIVIVGGMSAMETQQMVTFSGGFANMGESEYVTGVVVHELVHHWFGNTVTPKDWTGLWISEGAATYVEQLWQIDQGNVEEKAVVDAWRIEDEELRQTYGPPGDPDPAAFAASNSYYCVALMLYELRDEIGGAEAVDELLAAWVAEHLNQNVTRADFTAFVNEHTGKDLTAFIDAWLDSPTTPR